MSKITLAIVDDHQVVIDGLVSMLNDSAEIDVVFSTTHQQALLDYIKSNVVDVVMVDIHMPEINGIDLCHMILKERADIKILVFSGFDDTHYVRQALRKGASGYILKNAARPAVINAIHTVFDGREYIDEVIQKQIIQESVTGQKRSMYEIPLTKREKEILKLVAEEYSNQEIADQLFLSLRTVETHRSNLTKKLEAKNTASLVKEAIKRGLIS